MSRINHENDAVVGLNVAAVPCSKSIDETMYGCHQFVFTGYSSARGIGTGKRLSSDLFNVGGYEWKIDFLPDGEESNSIFASVYLVLASNVTNVRALFELTLVDRSGKGRHIVRRNYDGVAEESDPSIFTSKRRERGYKRFVRRSLLELPKYLNDDCLLLHCKIGVVEKSGKGPRKDSMIPIPPSDMGRAFKSMLECGVGCDITFLVEDETFKAHKVVLAARSPVFMAQFYEPFWDPNLDKVVIEDVKPSIFKAMITFIYSNELPDVHEIAASSSCSSEIITQHLLAAAQRYGLERLRQLCEEITVDAVDTLSSSTNVQNDMKRGRELPGKGNEKLKRLRGSSFTGAAALLPPAQVYLSEICCNNFSRLDLGVKGTRNTGK